MGVTLWQKVFVENEKKDLSELRKISNAAWDRDMVSEENERAVLRRIEKVMMRAMCAGKLTEKRRSQELMSLLSVKNILDQWCPHFSSLRATFDMTKATRSTIQTYCV